MIMDLLEIIENSSTAIIILFLGYIWIAMFINFFLFQFT